jgi:histidyl-tRNA synthetase
LTAMGVADFCAFDIGIVRGLAYYTGVVFEIFDRANQLRAIGGGGRYDNLLAQFGGPQVTATGLGMGDCVLGILLEEKGLLSDRVPQPGLDYFVASADPQYLPKAIEIAARLRRKGISAGFSYKPMGLGKQLKQASDQHAGRCIIVGDEILQGQLAVKDLATGAQELVQVGSLL